MSELVKTFEAAGFKATTWGFDAYEPGALFSRHVDVLRSPLEGRVAFELKIGWSWSYDSTPPIKLLLDLGNSYLSRLGVSWLPPDYPEGNTFYTFAIDDLPFVTTQGLHWINKWFDLWTNPQILLGLAQYQNGHISKIPKEVFSFLGFASNAHSKDHTSLAIRYAMVEDYGSALENLKKSGERSDVSKAFEEDLVRGESGFVCPHEVYANYKRCGGVWLAPDASDQQRQVFQIAESRMVAPNLALNGTSAAEAAPAP